MAIPIRHTTCGEIAMWYTGDREDNVVRSSTIVYLDGTRPVYGSPGPKLCTTEMSRDWLLAQRSFV